MVITMGSNIQKVNNLTRVEVYDDKGALIKVCEFKRIKHNKRKIKLITNCTKGASFIKVKHGHYDKDKFITS